jgi:hypothetical protein
MKLKWQCACTVITHCQPPLPNAYETKYFQFWTVIFVNTVKILGQKCLNRRGW